MNIDWEKNRSYYIIFSEEQKIDMNQSKNPEVKTEINETVQNVSDSWGQSTPSFNHSQDVRISTKNVPHFVLQINLQNLFLEIYIYYQKKRRHFKIKGHALGRILEIFDVLKASSTLKIKCAKILTKSPLTHWSQDLIEFKRIYLP